MDDGTGDGWHHIGVVYDGSKVTTHVMRTGPNGEIIYERDGVVVDVQPADATGERWGYGRLANELTGGQP